MKSKESAGDQEKRWRVQGTRRRGGECRGPGEGVENAGDQDKG